MNQIPFDWTAALVVVTGAGMIVGAFVWATSLIVRAEIGKLHRVFLPRKEAEARDREVDRRLDELVKAAAR